MNLPLSQGILHKKVSVFHRNFDWVVFLISCFRFLFTKFTVERIGNDFDGDRNVCNL